MRPLILTILISLALGGLLYLSLPSKTTNTTIPKSVTILPQEPVDNGNETIPTPILNDPETPTTPPVTNNTSPAKKTDDEELLYKIDQLFIIGFRGYTYESAPDIKKALSETNLGGVILFDYDTPTKRYVRNIQSESQIKKLTSDLQSHAKTKLFIAIDEEGGKVSRLKNVAGFNKTASAAYLGTQSTSYVESTAKSLGLQLANYGFSLDFAPVLDVNVTPTNPVIGAVDRSFSSDPIIVSEKGIAFMKGLQKSNIISVGKHFPGHGSSTTDSHLGFVDITSTYKNYELDPFKSACQAGIKSIMIAHVYNKNVDPIYPATLSSKHIQKLKDIGCKNQLIISDDMDMRAISLRYGRKTALIRAINSGIDVIIISNNVTGYDKEAFFKARKIVFDAVKSKEIPMERINEAYEKVKSLK